MKTENKKYGKNLYTIIKNSEQEKVLKEIEYFTDTLKNKNYHEFFKGCYK